MKDSLKGASLDISVVVVTCNSEKFIKPCLESVFGQAGSNIEVIIIDNGSGDKTASIVKEKFPYAALIENSVNLGAAQARNQGIGLSKGKWILTLDCDVVLENGFFSGILEKIKNIPDRAGMLQPKILNFDKKTIYSCGIYLAWTRRFYDIGSGKRDAGQFNVRPEILGPCSAAALYSRRMLDELKEGTGYFDKRFFFLVEDVDLAWRAQRRKWICLAAPGAVCYHHGNSSCLDRQMRRFLNFRNRYLMIRKNEGALRYLVKIIPCILYDLPRFFFMLIANGHFRDYLFRNARSENEALK